MHGYAADETLASFVIGGLNFSDAASITALGDRKVLFEILQRKPAHGGRAEDADLLRIMADGVTSGRAINFMQGDFKKSRPLFSGLMGLAPSSFIGCWSRSCFQYLFNCRWPSV